MDSPFDSEFAPLALDDELELMQIEEQLAEIKAANGVLFYKPHPKQDLFHRAGKYKLRYMRTGNRFGKSTLGAAEDVAWALGYRPWYPEGDPARYEGIPRKSNKILVICQDWDKVNEIFTNPEPGQNQGKIFNLLPKDSIAGTPSKSKTGVIALIKVRSKWGGTSAIYFDTVRSYQADPMSQESSDWDAIHVDEPCPEGMWKACSRGLVDRNGSAWFTCTPLSQMWINDKFIKREELRNSLVDRGVQEEDSIWWMSGSIHDNTNLPPEAIKRFLNDLTEAERQCREKGLPLSLSGLVYKGFDTSIHTYGFGHNEPTDSKGNKWEAPWLPPEDYTIRMAVDPHGETPHAVLFAATSPHEEVYFFANIFEAIDAQGLADRINDTLYGYELSSAIMDPAGFATSANDKSSMAADFDRYGIYCTKASKDLARGIILVQAALNKTVRLPSGKRVPWLRFGKHLTRTLWEFDHYEWRPGGVGKPIDRDDHMMECLYRLVINGLHYIPREKDEGRQLIVPSRKLIANVGLPDLSRPSNRAEALRRVEYARQRREQTLKSYRRN